jgi:putative ABC transport system permease protein
MLHQVRATLRGFRHRRALAVTVVAMLTMCIGATTTIFAAVDALLLRPLPYPAADRLVVVHETNLQQRETEGLVAPVRVSEWAAAARTLDGIAGCYFENLTDTSVPLPERVEAMRVSPGFFSLFAVAPLAGRTFSVEEEQFIAPVAVISEPFWTRRFNRDRAAIGRQLTLGTGSYTVVGVMPASFAIPDATTEVWTPMALVTQRRNRDAQTGLLGFSG